MGFLSTSKNAKKLDLAREMQFVVANGGPSPWRQFWQIAKLRYSKNKFSAKEYYHYGFWRPEFSRKATSAFVSIAQNQPLNRSLDDPSANPEYELVADKVRTLTKLTEAGLPVVPISATFEGDAPGAKKLHGRGDIVDFLSDPSVYPLFGKPIHSSGSLGAIRMDSLNSDTKEIELINGFRAPVAALANEIVTDWSDGYIFQPAIINHKALLPFTGYATASLRICTRRTEGKIVAFLAMMKLPSATSMHDASSINKRGMALIDLKTAKVSHARLLPSRGTSEITEAPGTGADLGELSVPFLQQSLRLCEQAHAEFKGHGILGFDVFVTDDGPLISEVNSNPDHSVIQFPTGKGLWNTEYAPFFIK